MDVGVRELKAHLSEYLDRAEEGETITVTQRGRPKAVLGPTVLAGASSRVRNRILQGIEEGWITPGTVTPDLTGRRGFKTSKSSQELLDEDRSG